MASYIANANGNFNTGSTWGLVDATSLLDSEAGTTEPGTSYSSSSTFVPGAIEVDGVAVKLAAYGTAGAYTVSLQLYNSTDAVAVAGTEVTINQSDMPVATAANNDGGWVFFKFAAVTLDGTDAYVVQLKESSPSANILFYRNGTASNWSRMLRTTTAAASPPAAASILHVMEEKTGAGAATARAVTMDAIASSITKYGSGTDATAALTVSDGGTLNYGTSAATDYLLQLDGYCRVYNGGTLTMGTVGSEIPRNSSAVLEFEPTADGGMGVDNRSGGTFTAQGLSRTVGKVVVSCLLNTDEAIASTSLGVDTDTGWLDNDVIAVASTTRTFTECEKGTLNGDAGASSLAVDGFAGAGGGVAYAHSGTTPTQAEVILLTRNVKIRSTSSSIMAYFNAKVAAVVDLDWVEFYYLGNASTDQYPWSIQVTTGSWNADYCSMHDCEDSGVYVAASATATINYLMLFNCSIGGDTAMLTTAATPYTLVIDHCIFMYHPAFASNGVGIYLQDVGLTFTNNTLVGLRASSSWGMLRLAEAAAVGTISDITIHSCNATYILGFTSIPTTPTTLSDFTIWRNAGAVLLGATVNNTTFNNFTIWGNLSQNIYIQGNNYNNTFNNLISDSETGYTTTNGIYFALTQNIGAINLTINNGEFSSSVVGSKIAHTNDILISGQDYQYTDIKLNNTKMGGTNEVANNSYMIGGAVRAAKYDQSTGATLVHKTWLRYGVIITDNDVFNTATPSMKMTPNNASYKLESGSFKVNVNSGQTCTPSVYTRKSEAAEGDSANYNGNHQRLILKRNDAVGITADTVIDTAAGAIGNPWEQLTGTTAAATENGVMEFVVDCDGTTGFVNVDDFTATVA